MATEGTIGYYRTVSWNHIPPPFSASSDEKNKWKELPPNEKMGKLISKAMEENPHSAEVLQTLLDRCWKAEEFKNGPDLLNITQQCLKLPTASNSTIKEPTFIIVFKGGEEPEQLELPYRYKPALAKDSEYFEKLFYGGFKESQQKKYCIGELTKAEFESFISHWTGSAEIKDFQAAYDSLMTANLLNLFPERVVESFTKHVSKLSIKDPEDFNTILALSAQFSSMNIPRAKEAISDYITNTYLVFKRTDPQNENIAKCLQALENSSIQKFNLSNKKITDIELAELLHCLPKINKLLLQEAIITDKSAEEIAKLINLRELHLSGTKITDKGLEHLKTLKNLRVLYLSGCYQTTEHGLEHLKALKNLRKLYLNNYYQVSDQGLEHLKALVNLTVLHLSDTKITDNILEHLKALKNLRKLYLNNCHQVSDQGLEHLKALTSLRVLNLYCCYQVCDIDLEHLKALTNLTELNLIGCYQVSDQGLKHLKALVNLRRLELGACYQVSDQGLEHLKALTNLRKLYLHFCQEVSDNGLEHLKALENLTELYLNGCQGVSDQGLEHLKALANLRELYLSETTVTDNGLKHLKALTHLRELYLSGTKVTGYGASNLRAFTKERGLDLKITQ